MTIYIVTEDWTAKGESQHNILDCYATRELAEQRVAKEKEDVHNDWPVDLDNGWEEETDLPGCYELNRDDYEYTFSCWIEEKEIIGL